MFKGSLLRPAFPSVAILTVAVTAVLGVIAVSLLSLSFGGGQAEAATVTVRVGNNWFCDPADGACMVTDLNDIDVTTNVNVGDTVVWEWGSGGSGTGIIPHTTTHCAANLETTCDGPREWDSSPAKTSGTFSHTFGSEDAGKTFLYRCQVHPSTMRGEIIVQGAGGVGGIGGTAEGVVPQADSAGSTGEASARPPYTIIAAASVAAVIIAAGAWYARRRWLE